MEKTLKPYDKEFMRAAILKHDQIFKEQVHELHRLYRVQKILMNGTIQTNDRQQPSNHRQNSQCIDIHSVHGRSSSGNNNHNNNNNRSVPVDANINGSNGMFGSLGCSPRIEEGEIELTLGLGPAPSNGNHNSTSTSSRRKTMDQKTPPTTTASAGGRRRQSPSSSSSTGSSQTKKAATDTVLMKQQNVNGTRPISDELISRQLTWGFLQGGSQGTETADRHMSFQNGGNINSANDGSDKINHRGDHEHLRQQPTWLFQALSLKLT